MTAGRGKGLCRRVAYTFADMVAVPIVKWASVSGLSRPLNAAATLYRHISWKARLGSMGAGTCFWPHVVIHNPKNVQMGSNVSIAEFVHIWAGGGVTIGDNVLIAAHAVITSQTHDADGSDLFRNTLLQAPVHIEDNVWIGSGAVILPGVHIGTGSIVGAGSVVTRDIPEGTIMVGVPANAIRQRDRNEKQV